MAAEKSDISFREMFHSVGRNVKFGVLKLGKVHKSVFKAVFPFLFKDKAFTVEEEQRLKEEFDEFDRNRDGFISLQEMESVFKATGHDDKRCEEMFEIVDADRDGQLDFDEYKRLKLMLIG